uniref:GLOBIN domain-containing protein n=2 Tax=Macrostomum lignano TaxID=282301 RepID=A0A1I8J904_9PLAT
MGCAQVKGRIGVVNFGESPLNEQSDKVRTQLDCSAEARLVVGGAAKSADPKLGLSDREIFKLRTTWKAVHRNVADTGVEMFISLFKSNQDLQAMFLKFSKLELSDNIRDNGDLALHGQIVMGILDEAIVNIDNPDFIRQRLGGAAATHRRFTGFYGKLFWAMEQPFLEAVRITLADRFNDSIAQIYAKTICYVLQEMEDAFNESE